MPSVRMVVENLRLKKNSSMIRSYSELRRRVTFEERFRYLSLDGHVGVETFGTDRYINQRFYQSYEWRTARFEIIERDRGCDLGVEGFEIHSELYIHHLNPITTAHLVEGDPCVLDPENLITTTHITHNAIHYGDVTRLPRKLVERAPGDTKLWLEEGDDMDDGTEWTSINQAKWPNQKPVIDGVTPVVDVSQDPDLFAGDEDSLDEVMGV